MTERWPSQPGDDNRAEKMREAAERLRKYTFYPRNEKLIASERNANWGSDLYPDRFREVHDEYGTSYRRAVNPSEEEE